MAAIAVTQVTLYPTQIASAEVQYGGPANKNVLRRRLQITGVTAGDTATPAVLGFSNLFSAFNGYNQSSAGVVPAAVDPVGGNLLIGTGPSNATITLIVEGTPKAASAT